MSDKTTDFKVTVNDEVVHLKLVEPTMVQYEEAQRVYNRNFRSAAGSGAILKAKLDDYAKEQGVWNDESQSKLEILNTEVLDLRHKLDGGDMELEEGKTLALKIMKLEDDMRDLLAGKIELDQMTAEGQASNSRFNYLLSVCLVYNDTGKPYFTSLEEYLRKSNDASTFEMAKHFSEWLQGEDGTESVSIEQQFLRDYGFANNKGHFINEGGHLIDKKGRLVNEDGRFVDKEGNFVDINGRPIDKDGKFIVERKPFRSKDGNPVEPKN